MMAVKCRPNVAPVNRCDGFCGEIPACIPTRTHRKMVLVKRSAVALSKKMILYYVKVEEHTECSCDCKITEKDCNSYEQYKRDQCVCVCNNFQKQDEEACNLKRKMVWNPKSCKCVCDKPEEECSTWLEWITSVCSCRKVTLMG